MIEHLLSKTILVTGGAGFMGADFISFLLEKKEFVGRVVSLDALTYAANQKSIAREDKRYHFIQENVCHADAIGTICEVHRIEVIVHFAAETHVDRSIEDPLIFTKTNVLGTQSLLEVVKRRPHIHFHHISTDEVYGSVKPETKSKEGSPYAPSSPYSASKAASDHLVRSYARTFHLSTSISHSCNNFGPYQFPEKLIPLTITRCLKKEPIPLYGKGLQLRDWLFVRDHSRAVFALLERGQVGEVYNIGSGRHRQNIEVVKIIIEQLSDMMGEKKSELTALITYVEDRPGHDFCYSLDTTKMQGEIGWMPLFDFSEGIQRTLSSSARLYSSCLLDEKCVPSPP